MNKEFDAQGNAINDRSRVEVIDGVLRGSQGEVAPPVGAMEYQWSGGEWVFVYFDNPTRKVELIPQCFERSRLRVIGITA